MNNLDPDVAERPDALVVDGDSGCAVPGWEAFDAIVRVGIGSSRHPGMVGGADGTPEAELRLERVLPCDPGMSAARHTDAGHPAALATAARRDVRIPMAAGRPLPP